MKIYNTLTRQTEDFVPINNNEVRMYSCGPTVYDHAHIGNLSSYIFADTLRRVLKVAEYDVQHVMNLTDIEDKIIRRSRERFPDESPEEALHKLTREYGQLFFDDMTAIGNDTSVMKFVWATESIEGIRALIADLYDDGFAYVADGSVYFSIEKYKAGGKKYGQLLKLNAENTSEARIDNDEYDKDSVHDFALWKGRKPNEPAWDFELDGQNLLGRPGWHIECSVMSTQTLGQPFDIHTGGVDLIFPHHENEIAQSTAGKGDVYAKYFVHNEHLLIEGKKMSKSLNNFYTLQDVRERGYDPLAFRLLILQSHYRKQSNFTWENLEAAQNRLKSYRDMSDLRWQTSKTAPEFDYHKPVLRLRKILAEDMNTPSALAFMSALENNISEQLINPKDSESFAAMLQEFDELLGLGLADRSDINPEQKSLITQRQSAREAKDWPKSDELRNELHLQGIAVRDTEHGSVWSRL